MFRIPHNFIFPRLVSLKELKFKSWSNQDTTTLYKLDWDTHDSKKLKRHEKRNRECWPSKDIPFIQVFPEPYESLLKNFRYTIPQNYIEEIRHSTFKAVKEWNMPRHFETNIRDICLTPAIEHIKVAFRLLNDCLYDEKENYFLRSPFKHIFYPQLHLIRFWQHQTGPALILKHSDFYKVEHHLSILPKLVSKNLEKSNDSKIKGVKNFISFAKKHEKKLLKNNEKITAEETTVKGKIS